MTEDPPPPARATSGSQQRDGRPSTSPDPELPSPIEDGRPTRRRRRTRGVAVGCGTATTFGAVALGLLLFALASLPRGCTLASPCSTTEDPLTAAAYEGDGAAMRRSLDAGADPDTRDDRGAAPLGCAVEGGHVEAARELVEHGAHGDRLTDDQRARLFAAVLETDDLAGYEAFVAHGVFEDPMVPAGSGPPRTAPPAPTFLFGPGSSTDIVERVVRADARRLTARLIDRGTDPQLVLRRAVEDDKAGLVDLALRKGADANPTEPNRETLLTRAAFNRNEAIVEQLLTAGADPDAGGSVDPAALWWALTGIEARAPKTPSGTLDGVFIGGATVPGPMPPLVVAAANGDDAMTRTLLARGADPNALGFGVYTPLYAAAIGGNPDVVRALLAAGADPHPVTVPGVLSPHEVAVRNGRTEIADLIPAP